MDKLRVQATGFPVTTETYKFMVEAYESIAEALSAMIHPDDAVILSGVVVSGSNVSDGFIVFKGELYRFVGGPKTNTVVIMEDVTSVDYNTDISNSGQLTPYDTYFKRYARCGNPGDGETDFPFSSLRRLDQLIDISDRTKPATTVKYGIIEIATQTEVDNGSDNTRAVTPATLNGKTATETRRGVIEIATQAEVDAGTDNTRAVTPATLKGRNFARIIGKRTHRVDVATSDGTILTIHRDGSSTHTGYDFGTTNYIVLASFNNPTAGTIKTVSYDIYNKTSNSYGFHWNVEFQTDPDKPATMDIDIIIIEL